MDLTIRAFMGASVVAVSANTHQSTDTMEDYNAPKGGQRCSGFLAVDVDDQHVGSHREGSDHHHGYDQFA